MSLWLKAAAYGEYLTQSDLFRNLSSTAVGRIECAEQTKSAKKPESWEDVSIKRLTIELSGAHADV